MNRQTYICAQGNVKVEVARFDGAEGSTPEAHVMLHLTRRGLDFDTTVDRIEEAIREIWTTTDLQTFHPLLKRYFLSDPANQAARLEERTGTAPDCAVSVVGQAPLDGTKVALWIQATAGPKPSVGRAGVHAMETAWEHNGLTHFWHTGYRDSKGDSADQTETLLQRYTADLKRHGLTLAENCQRTWFFVHDVDVHYGGVVRARRDFFAARGLTRDTHYIASTGIQGRSTGAQALVQLDGYAVKGLLPDQISYLHAPTHLNPTYEYGVTFERGTRIAYADRTHLLISGTASIDHRGEVVHVGRIVEQTRRMWDNVEALLQAGGSCMDDIAHLLVYLRDPADYEVVQPLFAARFPHTPQVFLWAPVCRPQWLIEMECIAIRPDGNPAFPAY